MEKISSFHSKDLLTLLHYLNNEANEQIYVKVRSKKFEIVNGKLNYCKWTVAALRELGLVDVDGNNLINLTNDGKKFINSLDKVVLESFYNNTKSSNATLKTKKVAWAIIMQSEIAKKILKNNIKNTLFYKTLLQIDIDSTREIKESYRIIWEASGLHQGAIKSSRTTKLGTQDNRLPGWFELARQLNLLKNDEDTNIENVANPKVIEVVVDKDYIRPPRQKTKTFRKPLTRIERQNANEKAELTGLNAEKIILNYERNFLINHNKKILADKIRHVSQESNDFGYDILSYNIDGTEKKIEVKYIENIKSIITFKVTYNEWRAIVDENVYVGLVDKEDRIYFIDSLTMVSEENKGNSFYTEKEFKLKLKS